MSEIEGSGGIVDDVAHHRLLYEQGGEVAELIYRRNGDRLVIVHTEVPEAIGGQGIGGRLVHAALEQAATKGLTLVPSCPYARKWLEDHPGDTGAVTIDWSSPRSRPA